MRASPFDRAPSQGETSQRADAPTLWRSLEQQGDALAPGATNPADEFPPDAALWFGGESERREFLKRMGAAFALAGLTGCARRTRDEILPYVRQPEEIVPGEPLYYATAVARHGLALGVLVESHMGRPTKIEGNPDHPASLGATDATTQAAILDLYSPHRERAPELGGVPRPWADFDAELINRRERVAQRDGAGLAVVFESTSSPTLRRQLAELKRVWPETFLVECRPGRPEIERLPWRTHCNFAVADVIVSFDADFLEAFPDSVRCAREFSARRKVASRADARMNQLLVAESAHTLTGAMADHRLPASPPALIAMLRALAARVTNPASSFEDLPPHSAEFLRLAADALLKHPARSLVLVGPGQPLEAHRLAHAINAALGNVASSLECLPNPLAPLPGSVGFETLADAAGQIHTLLFLDTNPAHWLSAEAVAEITRRVEWTARLGLEPDETGALCRWRLPQAHFLETWSDLRATTGEATITQPLIEPLYHGRSAHQILDALLRMTPRHPRALVQETWRGAVEARAFDKFWRQSLHDGLVAGTRSRPLDASVDPFAAIPPETATEITSSSDASESDLWALFRPDPRMEMGRHARNPWLLELPQSLTSLVWDNAALIAPALAAQHGLGNGDILEFSLGGRRMEAPVWILPGHDPASVTFPLGYGRAPAGGAETPAGFNAGLLQPDPRVWNAPGLQLKKTGRFRNLVTTQEHHDMRGRALVVEGRLDEFLENPRFIVRHVHAPGAGETLYPEWPSHPYAWGMVIDLTACTGCRACVIACQAENNIPVVGRDQVALGREMHWIRVDRYFAGPSENPRTFHQPVPCMHCENAPCEVVCPVAATVHSTSGLNTMVYNRCVGTRYCSNNCPYKVRRFNFLEYQPDRRSFPGAMRHNPDVTVRMRGVMEKCTYCVQRINRARIASKNERRRIRDGEVIPACAQACPANAIQFGDLSDPNSRVRRLAESPLNYSLLAELNARPRTTYLARIAHRRPPA